MRRQPPIYNRPLHQPPIYAPQPPSYQYAHYQNTPAPKPIQQAAPLPALPQALEVRKAIADVEARIQAEQMTLASYLHLRSNLRDNTYHAMERNPGTLGIVFFNNSLISHPLIDSIAAENNKKAHTACENATIDNSPFYLNTFQLPQTEETIDNAYSMMPLLFTSVFWRRQILREREQVLAGHYFEIFHSWAEQVNAIDAYNVRTHDCDISTWPEDIGDGMTKVESEKELLTYCARDEEMILDPMVKTAMCFYDDNRYVADPSQEHNDFRNRLIWTEAEKKTYFDQFLLTPKQFKRIADKLPMKNVKDCIEFYYVNKAELGGHMKAAEIMQKRRGGKKKVIAEGIVK